MATVKRSNRFGEIRSRLSHPVDLTYKGKHLAVPPSGVIPDIDKNQLSPLPKGIRFLYKVLKSTT